MRTYYLLYSVGDDLKDDGGDASLVRGESDIWVCRRDAVWPSPATKEEIEAFGK